MEDCDRDYFFNYSRYKVFHQFSNCLSFFREEIEEKKTNKVENKEESKKPLVEDEDRYLHFSYGEENFHNDICTHTSIK